MPDLLRKPFGTHGKVHDILPQAAGWRYVGFSLYRLRPGEIAEEATGDREVMLVIVEGKAVLHAAGQDWGMLGERMNVFEKTPPHCAYFILYIIEKRKILGQSAPGQGKRADDDVKKAALTFKQTAERGTDPDKLRRGQRTPGRCSDGIRHQGIALSSARD